MASVPRPGQLPTLLSVVPFHADTLPTGRSTSVSVSRVSALRDCGLTLRQREFLVTVMVHSGCFLERQYCEFAGTVRGQNSREFMARLVGQGFARVIEPGPVRRGRRALNSVYLDT